jgi:hypothetical protein
MNQGLKREFQEKWETYFNNADLPLVFFFSDDEEYAAYLHPVKGHLCMIAQLGIARRGGTISFTKDTIGCSGGVRYSGFPTAFSANFKYFLSCGIPGKLEGERYKKTPELVERYVQDMPVPGAEGRYLVFKRWDCVSEREEPSVVIFLSYPDTISGLFTLANFRTLDQLSVITPFCSGCGSIISFPLAEREREEPRGVIGMFDVSARPFVDEQVLSFSAPMRKILEMIEDMDESFLTTDSWKRIFRRMR